MPDFLRTFLDTLAEIDARSVVDILLIAAICYALLQLLRGTTAMALLRGGLIIFVAASLVADTLDLTVLKWLRTNILTGLFVAVPIIFQPEIRRTLERVGRARVAAPRPRDEVDPVIDAIARGCTELSRKRHGALIVIERETGLEEYIATGRRIDAAPSEELLANIFFRNAPLHDGALIIRGGRMVAAACTLPLSEAPLDGHLGTRHKAAIGVTERTDAVAVIVSEETGDISVAANGRLVSKLDDGRLRALLAGLLGRQERGGWRGWLAAIRPRSSPPSHETGRSRPSPRPARPPAYRGPGLPGGRGTGGPGSATLLPHAGEDAERSEAGEGGPSAKTASEHEEAIR
jgi:diadenylate cyclase